MRRKFLDFGWFQQIVMFWVEWDSLISTGVEETFAAWRTHNSCVHLENLYQKSDKLKRHKFPTKRRKFPTKRRNFQPNGVNYFCCFQCIFGLWDATYLPMFPRACEYQKSAKNARMAADTARIPPNSWNGSFWLRRQKFLKRQFLKSGPAEKNYPADRPRYIINNYQNI